MLYDHIPAHSLLGSYSVKMGKMGIKSGPYRYIYV